MRAALLTVLLLLSACTRELAQQIDQVLPAPKAPALVTDLIPQRAVQLIIEFEIGTPERYERMYQAPIWPGAASGVTIGIGYDLGHQHAAVILQDWWAQAQRQRLADQAGITGPAAQRRVPPLQDIRIAYAEAKRVFGDTSLVTYYRLMLQTFPGAQALRPNAQGALTSLVYNRGGSKRGDSRREMRSIADQCVPTADYACIGRELRSMNRIWIGSNIERGMARRRDAEAVLAEAP